MISQRLEGGAPFGILRKSREKRSGNGIWQINVTLKDFERIRISWGWFFFWCGCVMSTSAIPSSLSRWILEIFIFWQYRIKLIQHSRWMVAWFFVQVTCCPQNKHCINRLYHWNCNHATRPTTPRNLSVLKSTWRSRRKQEKKKWISTLRSPEKWGQLSSNLQWPGVPSDTLMTDSPKIRPGRSGRWSRGCVRRRGSMGRRQMCPDEFVQ